MEDVTIYQLRETEIHMMGDYACVQWNLKQEKRSADIPDGRGGTVKATTEVPYRTGKPYISFASMRQGRDGSWYVDEDSQVQGWLSEQEARQVAAELIKAAKYLARQGA
jgi:hypothetical protein